MKKRIKKIIKLFVPKYVFSAMNWYRTVHIYRNERIRFSKNIGNHKNNNQQQIDAKLIFFSHALEKGLSHIDFRKGFGRYPLTELKKYLVEYDKQQFSKDSPAYKNSISCLKAYKNKHLEEDGRLPDIYCQLFSEYESEIEEADDYLGGISTLKKSTKVNNREINFEELFNNRVSVREFSDEPVNIELLEEAISISMKAPSVCNRQSSRVRIIRDRDIIREVLKVQGGYGGYTLPPILILITTDTNSFLQNTERNQIYIDGGLFAMGLLTSIEYVGLGACSLNSMFEIKTERKVRTLLQIPDNENFIMFISVGNLLDESPYPKSFRYSGKEITKIIG